MPLFESIATRIWNGLFRHPKTEGLNLGHLVRDGAATKQRVSIPHWRRPEHIAVLGKTGTGKSSLLRYMMSQDIKAGRGFLCIDLHGDLTPFVLSAIAEKERKTKTDLSGRLLLIDPSDPEYAVGLNLIECDSKESRPVQISEMVSLLRKRWSLDHFGARTEELLRNTLWVLSENNLTLLEVSPLLTNRDYRSSLLKKVGSQEVKLFFEERYDAASPAMQAVMREAVLNKMGAFTVDPAIRHIVGQTESSFSLRAAIDRGMFVCLNLRKGRLGENALIFAALFLAKLKAAIFSRQNRNLCTLYADELPNLVSVDGTFETLLSEARKFSVSVVTANQFLNQFSPAMKSALLSVGSCLSFKPSSEDAPTIARALDGEGALARRLTLLEHRHLICKFGEGVCEVLVPNIPKPQAPFAALTQRSMAKFGKCREEIEDNINARRPNTKTQNTLDEWE